MRPADYLAAARVPDSLKSQTFGPWQIRRETPRSAMDRKRAGYRTFVSLARTDGALGVHFPDVVMSDDDNELRKHLPIWLAGRGRILKTGLGLGCVVRGLLAKPEVEHVDVVEIDAEILRVVGAQFEGNPRVTLIHGDAFKVELRGMWDFAWHDIWCPQNKGLEILHAKLLHRFEDHAAVQGAWAYPRFVSRIMPWPLLGAPGYRRALRLTA